MDTEGNPKSTSSFVMKAAGAAIVASLLLWGQRSANSAEQAVVIAAPAIDVPVAAGNGPGPGAAPLATAIFAGGCFWGVQGVFQHVAGVTNVLSGYAGGGAGTARYDVVSSGSSGHAEAVRITYDPSKVSYGKLLQIFFSVAHDPTQLNRQGPDRGTQYRSAIFPVDPVQHKVAQSYIAQLDTAKSFNRPIVTTIEDNKVFYPAESYHQDYLTLNPTNPYIVINDLPKVENLKRIAPQLYRAQPVLVKTAL